MGSRYRFVEVLECAIMTLVEPPITVNWNPHQIHLIQRNPKRPHRACQQMSKRYVEDVTLFPEQLACSVAYSLPCSEGSTSVQPVKRLSRFHTLCP